MPKKHYDWSNGPATIKRHSIAKHDLLRNYLAEYFQTLVSSPNQDELKLTIVDGFAGGGSYFSEDTREEILGSPFICLKAAEEAEVRINAQRTKKVIFKVDFFFVEKNHDAANHLLKIIQSEGYSTRLDKNIRLIKGDFVDHSDNIISYVKNKSPKNGRSIFILDQYGYSDVGMPIIEKIFRTLPSAEVILTFSVDSLTTYLSDKTAGASLERIGLPNIFEGRSLQDIKNSESNWRAFIQSQLYPHIARTTGAKFHTPFFIRPAKGHGDIWLVHLSMHQKARDVMTEVHWKHGNTFIHYGGEGIDMSKIGYIASADQRYSQQNKLGYEFDDDAKKRTTEKLHEDIPRLIYADEDGLSFEAFQVFTCNDSPATARIKKDVLSSLAKQGDIEILSAEGVRKTSANQIKNADRILPPRQKKLFPL